MLRILLSPIRFPIPDRPSAEMLRRYRQLAIERVRSRIGVLATVRRGRAIADAAAPAIIAERDWLAFAPEASTHPVERICAAAGLGTQGSEVLSIIAAPYLDPVVRVGLAQHQSDLGAGLDLEVVRDLMSMQVDDADVSLWTGTTAIFERLGLIEVHRHANGRALITATARLLGLYDGLLVSDPRLADLVQWREISVNDADGVVERTELDGLVAGVKDVVRCCTPPLCAMAGAAGTGRTRVAQAIAARLGLRWVMVLEAALLAREPAEIASVLRLVERDATFLNALVVLRGVDGLDPVRQQVLASVLAQVAAPIVLTSEASELGKLETLVALRHAVRRPSAALRREAWSTELLPRGDLVSEGTIRDLAESYPLGRSTIARAVELAWSRTETSMDERLRVAAASQVRSQLERYAKRIVPRGKLSELVLAEETQEQVLELLHAVQNRPELSRFLGDALAGPKGIAALFNGPPGTGKTMTASAIAHELGLPLYRIDVSAIVDKYIGETEKNLARIFEEAESDRGLLLFDEADSLFSKRVEVTDSNDRHANMQVNMLLNLIDQYTGFVILTTNLKASLDTAFLRRMSFKVVFDMPETAERAALWQMHIPDAVPIGSDVDLEQLATRFRTSGGEIRNAVYRAILMAPLGTPLSMANLSRAASLELESAGNVVQRERA